MFQVNLARRNINPEYKRELRKVMKGVAGELKAEEKTQQQIGWMLGVKQPAVSKWLAKKTGNSIPRNNTSTSPPDSRTRIHKERHPAVVERLKTDTQVQVAVDFGVSDRQIRNIAKAEAKRQGEAAERQQRIETAKQLDTLGAKSGSIRRSIPSPHMLRGG